MDVNLSFILILTGLTGIHSIITVSKVSVKAGGSISIPCLYESKYIKHVKYLCKGNSWRSCSYAVKTDQQSSGKYSISDDKSRRIFTVTINDLTDGDTHYWCAVDIKGGADDGAYFHLSVTTGTPSLYVDRQEITGYIGEQITINCYNSNYGEIEWCKLEDSCVTSSGSIAGTRVTKSDRDVFTVTMSGLRTESSGWYWCAKGDFQMPVYLNVTQKPTTRIHSITRVSEVSVKAGGSISIPCLYDSQYKNHVKYLCKGYYWNSCKYAVRTDQRSSGKYSISDDKSRRIFTVTINDLTDEDTDYWCAVEINGGADERAYFHLSVTRGTPSLYVDHQEITALIGGNINISCHNGNNGAMGWCRLGGSCVTSSGSIGGTRVTIDRSIRNVFTVTMSGLRKESSGWYWCAKGDFQMPVYLNVELPTNSTLSTTSEHVTQVSVFTSEAPTAHGGHFSSTNLSTSFYIRLTLLILFVTVTSFIWFMVKRHTQIKLDSSATTGTTAEREVRYMRRTPDDLTLDP